MELSALGSGSSGNCFFVQNNKEAVLVDAGLTAKQIISRMGAIGKSSGSIKGILITHEHADHIRGADVLARQLNIPIFATKKTIQSSFLCSDSDLITPIKNDEILKIAGIEIRTFSKSHKAADPVSFSMRNGKTLSIITDAGFACENIISAVSESDFLCIESNHDENMLIDGPYPYFLKQWVKGDTGHLSNKQSALCVLEHAKSGLSNVVLSHLSQTNNTPDIALKTFKSLIKERRDLKPKISYSDRNIPTKLFKI
ncbi:MAG: MBL fold metallo-hydrolase [archaeon]|jgi:phosphoribosyl 1,2-cyclic phosphodiesterase|nr:MBL fold metallo-hydrolase [archaeon]